MRKLKIYNDYNGLADGYFYPRGDSPLNEISWDEWGTIALLLQDIYLVRTGLASESYEMQVKENLAQACDSSDTISEMIAMEKYMQSRPTE